MPRLRKGEWPQGRMRRGEPWPAHRLEGYCAQCATRVSGVVPRGLDGKHAPVAVCLRCRGSLSALRWRRVWPSELDTETEQGGAA